MHQLISQLNTLFLIVSSWPGLHALTCIQASDSVLCSLRRLLDSNRVDGLGLAGYSSVAVVLSDSGELLLLGNHLASLHVVHEISGSGIGNLTVFTLLFLLVSGADWLDILEGLVLHDAADSNGLTFVTQCESAKGCHVGSFLQRNRSGRCHSAEEFGVAASILGSFLLCQLLGVDVFLNGPDEVFDANFIGVGVNVDHALVTLGKDGLGVHELEKVKLSLEELRGWHWGISGAQDHTSRYLVFGQVVQLDLHIFTWSGVFDELVL